MKILFIAIAGILIVSRLIQNFMASERASDNLRETSENNDYAIDFAETLDVIVIVKRNVDTNMLKEALSNLSLTRLNNFSIKSFREVDTDTFLCLTLVKYEDLEMYGEDYSALASHALDKLLILLDHESKTCKILDLKVLQKNAEKDLNNFG
jgi:hypothetical protein